MKKRFSSKDEARQAVWGRLQAEGLARFPFPPHGRIPNFTGAEQAAKRLFELSPWKNATAEDQPRCSTTTGSGGGIASRNQGLCADSEIARRIYAF